MLLLDSLYINNGGGRVLLDYLVEELEKSGEDVFYLFDLRCSGSFDFVPESRKLFMPASLRNRHKFYKENAQRFSSVFCFGNLPPTKRLNVPVYTYFHQRLFLNIPDNLGLAARMTFKLKSRIFKSINKNTDYFAVQTQSIKEEFVKSIKGMNSDIVLVLPFYRTFSYPIVEKQKDSFIYVSSAAEHKNHGRLLDAFVTFYDKTKRGKLVLTVGESSVALINRIDELKINGYPIVNLGFIPADELPAHYAQAEFCIYPSLSESFGLGVIEAIEGGCKIIGADLDYMYAVCKPSLVFDPYSVESIASSFETAVTNDLEPSEALAKNMIGEVIETVRGKKSTI